MVSQASAQVREVEIETVGYGASRPVATNNALIEAISQVNGKSISSEAEISLKELSVQVDQESSSYSQEAYQKKVREASNGIILGYRVLGESKGDDGLYEIRVLSKVAEYKKSASTDRKRIAVSNISVSQSVGSPDSGPNLGERFSDSLGSSLAASRKFAILDRQEQESIERELLLIGDPNTAISERARLGNKLIADYIITANLDTLFYSVREKQSRIDDTKIKYAEGSVEAVYKLIEVATGEVVSSDRVVVRLSHDSNQLLSPSSGMLSLIDKVSTEIAKRIQDQIYPIAIVSFEGSSVVLNQGGGIRVGESYKVYMYGEKLYDPYTRESIGRKEIFCCVIKIERVTPKQAYAAVVSGVEFLARQEMEPKKFVLREKVSSGSSASKATKKGIDNIKKSIQSEDKDW